MGKITGLVFFVMGILLLIYGMNASESMVSFFSNLFNGAPSNKTIALLGLGAVFTALGVFSFIGEARSSK